MSMAKVLEWVLGLQDELLGSHSHHGLWLQTRTLYPLPWKLQIILEQLKQHILELTATKKKL